MSQGRLPDFIVVGTQKGGTVAAGLNLGKHDDVWVAPGEVHFFNRDCCWHDKGITWYEGLFTQERSLRGERSPNYLVHHWAHERMRSVVPRARLIVLLRNPVTRAYSAWNHGRADDWGSISEVYREHDFDPMIRDHPDVGCLVDGKYVDHLEHLLKFYPREQVHVAVSERVKDNMELEYDRMLAFLGSTRRGDVGYRHIHSRRYEKELSSWAKEYLWEYYRPYNDRLFNLLGYEIPEWSLENTKKGRRTS